MLNYNFEEFKKNNDTTIEGIYWNMRDSDHPEEYMQIGHFTEVTLEEEITPDEAIALVKTTLGAELLSDLEANFSKQPLMIEKLSSEEEPE